MELKGERVTLRHPRPEDAQDFLAMVAAGREYHRPWVYPPDSVAAYAEWVARADTPRSQCFLSRADETGGIVGVVNLTEIIRGPLLSAFLGFYGSAEQAGRGLMAESVRLVVAHAFGPLGLHRVEANIQPDNERSRALARSCGFSQEGLSPRYLMIGGRWRDHERWAILADA